MKKLICGILCGAALLAAAPAAEVRAEEIYPGYYSVTVVPTYQNPDTGAIDDVGQNPGIGTAMVQAQVQSVGYVEICDDGSIYLNTRWNQADSNIYAGFETSAICAEQRPLVRLPAATRRSTTATLIKVFR